MIKSLILLAITGVSLILIFWIPPVRQDLAFHNFADARSLIGIPNAGNILSNIPFLVIGVYGIVVVLGSSQPFSIRVIYTMLFIGVILTGFGSAYYHWHPDNDRLVCDRMPMTIVFMSFLSAIIAEVVSRPVGVRLLLPLVALGIASVLWWRYTEATGKGDLRLYFWVQFYPMFAIPMLLLLYYTPIIKRIIPSLVWIVAWYAAAKVLEQLDYQIFHVVLVSGHTLKHLAAAASTGYFVHLYRVKYLTPAASVVGV